jgi:hypothetical protein
LHLVPSRSGVLFTINCIGELSSNGINLAF